MALYVGSLNPVKINASTNALRTLEGLDTIEATGLTVPSGVADQPMTEAATRLGALNRVERLREIDTIHSTDWCVAIEGGVDLFIDGPAAFAYFVIDHNGYRSVGRSANLPLPNIFYEKLTQGQELGPVMDEAFSTDNIKQKGGAIGLLTNHLATRQSVYEDGLILALSRFRHIMLYN